MHRIYLSIILSALLLAMMSSCEVPVEIEGDSKIVVQSYFSDNQDLIVYVTESNNRAASPRLNYVENATVTLFSGDDFSFITTLVLTHKIGVSYYHTIDFLPKIGKVYMLNVEVPGYAPVTASNSIPLPGDLADVQASSVSDNAGGISTIDFEVTITINDVGEGENYYHLLFSQELIRSYAGAGGAVRYDTIILNTADDLFLETKIKTIDIDQIFDAPSFIMNDEKFNGETIKIVFNGHYQYDNNQYERGQFLVELRTVSKAYYDHYLSLLTKPDGDPLGGFDINAGNIHNGAGIFAGYSSSFKRFHLPD